MKKHLLVVSFITSIACTAYPQATTYYGTSAGTQGNYNSNFGNRAGENGTSAAVANTAVGADALRHNITGSNNVAVGYSSLKYGGDGCTAVGSHSSSNSDEDAQYNTAIGLRALKENYSGDNNTAIGTEALLFNQSSNNTALGYGAMLHSISGANNTAIGTESMSSSHDNGNHNTAHGFRSLYSNAGNYNTASGSHALYSNTTGQMNTTIGYFSLYANSTGLYNTASGGYALKNNINGSYNTASGYQALNDNNIGTNNTAAGYRALTKNTTGSYNTAHGTTALSNVTSGNYNTGVGYQAGQTLTTHLENTTAIGYLATPTASNQVRIGNTAVTSIGGEVNWTALSDGRFKKDIREDVSGLDFIKALRPVSYTVDNVGLNKFLHVNDSSSNSSQAKSVPVRQTGFVAQEVEALVKKSGYVFSGVDAPENENDPYGIRYAEFVVPLVKAVQELSKEVQEQRQQIQLLLAQLDSKTASVDGANRSATLLQNSPNPFDTETVIQLTLPDNAGTAAVMVYNLEGKQMKNVHVANRGDVTIKISGGELSAGMYLYSLIVDGKVVDTKRMVITK